ncbi:hypothetical protein [Haloplanus halophilus]|uniref:hypothetical protein n=1 Tax=Haloplanus halophilus TaxID=2949993 RepID=UPI00204148DC|nr:hypothetical protein [Haloplanus sp. GDY1]
MPRPSRRRILAGVGPLLAGLAGCGSSSSSTPDPSTDTATAAPDPARLRFDPVPVANADEGDRIGVYPPNLKAWIREAAAGDGPLRVDAPARVSSPDAPFVLFRRARVAADESDVAGSYAVRATGGPRYRYLADAREATPPADATVTPVSNLPEDRRRLVRAAVSDRARFYPETERGAWARRFFLGGYFRVDGTVYRGHELQRTDAAFFSETAWYVLDLDPIDGASAPTFDVGGVDAGVRSVIDELLDRRNPTEAVTLDAGALPESVVRFVGERDYLLTHAALLKSSVERGG